MMRRSMKSSFKEPQVKVGRSYGKPNIHVHRDPAEETKQFVKHTRTFEETIGQEKPRKFSSDIDTM